MTLGPVITDQKFLNTKLNKLPLLKTSSTSQDTTDWLAFRHSRNKCITTVRPVKSGYYLNSLSKLWKPVKFYKIKVTASFPLGIEAHDCKA